MYFYFYTIDVPLSSKQQVNIISDQAEKKVDKKIEKPPTLSLGTTKNIVLFSEDSTWPITK